jgi:hypothetical protein
VNLSIRNVLRLLNPQEREQAFIVRSRVTGWFKVPGLRVNQSAVAY